MAAGIIKGVTTALKGGQAAIKGASGFGKVAAGAKGFWAAADTTTKLLTVGTGTYLAAKSRII